MWDEGEGETFADVLSIPNRLAATLRCTAEHLTAKADGGPTTPRNIVAACRTCNMRRHRRRSPKPPDSYKMLVENRLARGAWHPAGLHAALLSFVATAHDGR